MGYDPSDGDYKKIGNDGGKGKKTVTLKAEECAMPSHTHSVSVDACIENDLENYSPSRVDGNNGGRFRCVEKSYTTSSASTAAKQPHENRPPYYVLAYIMKTV